MLNNLPHKLTSVTTLENTQVKNMQNHSCRKYQIFSQLLFIQEEMIDRCFGVSRLDFLCGSMEKK